MNYIRTTCAFLGFLLLAAGCEKNDASNKEKKESAESSLISPSTGWAKVGVIPFRGLATGDETCQDTVDAAVLLVSSHFAKGSGSIC